MAETKAKKLNYKQKMFCDWYIKLGGTRHGTQAAINAGYSKKTAYALASQLLKNVKVQEYLTRRRHELEDLLGFNKATVLQNLHEIKERSMQARPVMEWDRDSRR